MNFLSYWDIFGVVLITLYFILSWLYPKRTQQKPEVKAEKDGCSKTHEGEDLEAERDKDGVISEPFIRGKSDIPEFVWNTSVRSSLSYGDAHHAESTPQEVNSSSCKIDPSSVENTEKIESSRLISDLSLPSFESTNTAKGSVQSMQNSGQASNSPYDELLNDTSSKFSELILLPEDISLSLAEVPETENKERVGNVVDLKGNENDVSKPVEFEEVPSNSNMECNRNVEDGDEGLSPIDVGIAASVVSDFSDNLRKISGENTASRDIQTVEITSCNAEEISRQVLAEAMDAIDLQSSSTSKQQGKDLEKFANDLANTTIETAVDNSISLNTFAESLSEKIFSDSADDVILKVQTSLERQKIEAKMQKQLEIEEMEALGTCVASEVVNEAVGEAALKKEYMDNDELDVTSVQEIQPHISFVVENVVNSAICEAASKLKRGDVDEPTECIAEEETSGVHDKSNETETNNNVEAICESVILPVEEPLKDEAIEVVAEEDVKLESEIPFDFDKTLIEDLPVETSSKDVSEQAEEFVEDQREQLIVTDDEQNVIDKQVEEVEEQFEENVSELSATSFTEYAATENDRETTEDEKTNEELPVENIPKLNELIDAETKDETAISDSDSEAKDEPKNDQITAEDAKTDEETPVEGIATSQKTIVPGTKDETAIADSSKTKDKPELEQNVLPAVDLDNNFEIPKDNLDEPLDKHEDLAPVTPEIRLTLDKEKSNETEVETSPSSSPGLVTQHQVTLRNKDQQSSDNKDEFWRRSLILDLEEELEFEDSISSESYDVSSPDLPKEKKEVTPHSEDSGDFTDSEEDEVIDHDAEARLGAVGGSSKLANEEILDEDFDWYDYEKGSDEEDDGIKAFEPVLTVDGLCASRQSGKEKPKLKSVGSHYNRAVVLDNGSGIIKLGYAGDRVPRVIQQNVTGMPQRFSMHITRMESNLKDYKKYGSEAVAKAGVMHLTHPMKAGLIENWTDIEEIWEYLLYDELGAEVGDNPVLVTEISQNPKKNREKIAEILFEHLNVPAMFLADQLPLSLYASGFTSGVCLSSGYSCTQAGVVYEGHTLAYTEQQLDIGGGDLTENLKILLRDIRARNFTTSSGWQIVNDIKENLAFVAKDYDHDVEKYQKNDSLTQYYKLPDGQMVDVGYECMSCVEPLFQPDTLMSANSTTASQQPVHKLIDTAIKRCDPELQDHCYKHIVLSGGTTLLKGFTSRLQHELHRTNPRIRKIRAPEHRRHSPWIGGSILASLSIFDEQYVTVDDYSESGSQVIHMKCF